MALKKNVASQIVIVYAYDLDNEQGKTGDAANITAQISKDGAAFASTNDTNPTEIGLGSYAFTLTQAETNADLVFIVASTTTANIQINPVSNYTESAISVSSWSGDPNATILALVTAAPDIASDIAEEEDSFVPHPEIPRLHCRPLCARCLSLALAGLQPFGGVGVNRPFLARNEHAARQH
jgi:hypothetical protein